MRVSIRKVEKKEQEQVLLECVSMTKEFEDIREYVLMKGNQLTAYLDGEAYQILLGDVLYFEAVSEHVFAYTVEEVYFIKKRLYEVEQEYSGRKFVRASKSMVVNLMQVESFRPALNGRFYARMKNGEDIIISRQYAKAVKQKLLGEAK